MRYLVLPCCALLVVLPVERAAAQDYEAAGRHFAAAQEAFSKGSYAQAAESFQAAYDITRDPALLFNIGESWQRAGQLQRALASYRAYLTAQPQASDRPEVERRIRELEAASPAPPPAAVPKPSPGQLPAEERRQLAPASPWRTAAWATVAGAVAVLTAAGVLGLGAQNRADELTRRTTLLMGGQPLPYNEAEREAYASLMSEGHAYNTAAIVCFAVASATAAAGAVLFLIDWRKGRSRPPGGPAKALVPNATPGALSWAF
ncbi:MAG: hypothetical protein RMK29_08370 [Myxococcales bacterium]|nr:hypothetical protein [Myxococcota bacterium]MDW8281709.1 hypothetical protein [Myxococcales bacterium]